MYHLFTVVHPGWTINYLVSTKCLHWLGLSFFTAYLGRNAWDWKSLHGARGLPLHGALALAPIFSKHVQQLFQTKGKKIYKSALIDYDNHNN